VAIVYDYNYDTTTLTFCVVLIIIIINGPCRATEILIVDIDDNECCVYVSWGCVTSSHSLL